MSIYDRWHKTHPSPGDRPCREHSRAKTVLYPTKAHGIGDRWQVRWRDENDRQRKRNFAVRDGINPEKHAAAFDAKNKHELDTGTSLDIDAGQVKVRAYAAEYRKNLLHRDSTAERLDRFFRLHVDPLPLGNLQMIRVRPSTMRAWVKDRSEALAPSTLAVAWSNLVTMFSAAVADRVIGVSPCTGVTLPEVHHQHYIPSDKQVHMLASAMAERYSTIVYVAAGCGWRGAEITGLEISAIDFDAAEIDVTQQLVCVTGKEPYLGPPKTRKSVRTNEIPELTLAALKWHVREHPPVEVEIWDRTDPDKRRHHRRVARLVFTTASGNRPIARSTWAHMWMPAARAAGIPKGTGLHCLRHYFATRLIHSGANVKRVQLALGHSTPTITLNTYVGEWPDTDRQTRAILDSALGSCAPGVPWLS